MALQDGYVATLRYICTHIQLMMLPSQTFCCSALRFPHLKIPRSPLSSAFLSNSLSAFWVVSWAHSHCHYWLQSMCLGGGGEGREGIERKRRRGGGRGGEERERGGDRSRRRKKRKGRGREEEKGWKEDEERKVRNSPISDLQAQRLTYDFQCSVALLSPTSDDLWGKLVQSL